MGEGEMRRTSIVELVVDKSSEERLKPLYSLSSKLWNEVSYARREDVLRKERSRPQGDVQRVL
jgi:hypothetical protein